MNTLSLILSFVFGAVVGSFLNVVSLRMNTGVGVGGRSKCMSCGTQLSWKELIPIASFLAQKGACRKCKSRISWQYPLVEFTAGAVFVLLFLSFPPLSPVLAVQTFLYILTACLLTVISVYDIRHKIIPDPLVFSFAAVSLIGLFVGGPDWWHTPSIAQLLAGPLIALPFALLWLGSKGRWMGLGDAKLALGIGWTLGIAGAVNAVVLSFWIAAAVSVAWIFARYKRFKSRMEIPFGPYLILGMYLVLLFGVQVMDVHLLRDIVMSYYWQFTL